MERKIKKNLLLILAILYLLVIGCNKPVNYNQIWQMYGYDAQHTGQCPYSTLRNLGLLKWKFETGNMIQSSPVIASDGTIYVGSDDNFLYAIYPNGKIKWKKDMGVMIRNSPAIGKDGTIYVGSF